MLMGLFDDLFGNDKKKSQQAFGLFSFMNEQQDENNSEYTDEEFGHHYAPHKKTQLQDADRESLFMTLKQRFGT